jgi:hypothetical protein
MLKISVKYEHRATKKFVITQRILILVNTGVEYAHHDKRAFPPVILNKNQLSDLQ